MNYGGELRDDEHLICCDCDSSSGGLTSSDSGQHDTTSKVHCRISVDDMGCFCFRIWKDPSDDLTTIQLNGESVMRMRKGLKLNFGDEIMVLVGNEDEDKERHRFRFDMIENKYGNVEMGSSSSSGTYFFPGHIHTGHGLIFHEIISYLPFNDLKNVRQVNRLWEEEVTTTLMKKSIVFLLLDDTDRSLQDVRMTLLRFATEVGHLARRKKIVNMDICLPVLMNRTTHDMNQTLHDFNRYFLNLQGLEDSVKQLEIKGGFVNEDRVVMRKLWKGCLEKFQNVEELALDASAVEDGEELPDFSALHYPHLKRFKLYSNDWFNALNPWNREVQELIVMSRDFPAVKTWMDGCFRAIHKAERIEFYIFPFIRLFLEGIKKGPRRLIKLSGLNLGLLDPSNFPQLLAIRIESLTFLELEIFEETPINEEEWQRLFEAQGASLQHLILKFHRGHGRGNFIPCIKLPAVFPKLHSLEILEYPNDLELELTWVSKPGDVVDYAKTFPKLKHLSLFASKYYHCDFTDREVPWRLLSLWAEKDAVWNAVLGTSNPCTTLKTLNIPHLGKGTRVERKVMNVVGHMSVHSSKWDSMIEYYKDIKRIATLFPAVQHEWIVEIRNGGGLEEDPDGLGFGLVEKLMWKIPILTPN